MHETAPLDEELEALLAYLRDERGADFTGYKRPSLTRLIHRRVRTTGVDSYGEYVDLLQVEPSELDALLDVLLIDFTGCCASARTCGPRSSSAGTACCRTPPSPASCCGPAATC